MSKTLAGKVALVTGGSRGLGTAIAIRLAELGADVAFSYVASGEKAAAVAETLQQKGVRTLAIQNDQGDPFAAQSLVDTVINHFGRLDILVNNAAIAVQGHRIDDPNADFAELDRQWRVNVLGVVALTRAAAQKITDGGRIVFVGSGLGGRVALPTVTEYSATKAALVGYAKGASRDLGPRNITVNVVQPGIMPTDMAAAAGEVLPPGISDTMSIARIATLEEVAASIAFLVGPDAGYITGAVLDISGGYQA
ncbi:SDR family oxidoreductase [Enterobacteriaceae bacterium H20N1]|uniref:SDR family oxidoreductase n=1 Tax=Dryocola boscaweniae TaxID=2925397 RepID=A0A9X2WAM1_9ENTR|nr:SDR family oxidoreductase [Dryocola boscaweniae]MCT4703198.1 SDR family oxidoreductase [Dryocola boscaweniae]MCT4715033.1 SDR family oxidoreductase [Dryocola boscaweniae]MCT4720366.1 SDR family oxidoreductase [Dryocola boscaweniae]